MANTKKTFEQPEYLYLVKIQGKYYRADIKFMAQSMDDARQKAVEMVPGCNIKKINVYERGSETNPTTTWKRNAVLDLREPKSKTKPAPTGEKRGRGRPALNKLNANTEAKINQAVATIQTTASNQLANDIADNMTDDLINTIPKDNPFSILSSLEEMN